jgi:hypothetical protein
MLILPFIVSIAAILSHGRYLVSVGDGREITCSFDGCCTASALGIRSPLSPIIMARQSSTPLTPSDFPPAVCVIIPSVRSGVQIGLHSVRALVFQLSTLSILANPQHAFALTPTGPHWQLALIVLLDPHPLQA